ncbi:MAG: hypothetical protein IJ010_02110 [Ruminococcus sp.]|nr:hypothetical protein [Ruminococcus sp.]
MLNNWILRKHDVQLSDWKNGDLCADGIIDVFDLCIMRQLLLKVGV